MPERITRGDLWVVVYMSLFICENPDCKSIENTALCLYWTTLSTGTPKLCSACDPKIKQWHGHFKQRQMNPETEEIVDGYVVGK